MDKTYTFSYTLLELSNNGPGSYIDSKRRRSGEIGIRSRLKSRPVSSAPSKLAPGFEFISMPIQVLSVPEFDTK